MSIYGPRLYQSSRTFSISAQLTTTGCHGFDYDPILFIETTCLAMVDYCLLGRRWEVLDKTKPFRLDPNGPEHLEVCMRMRRCGAVKLTPQPFDWHGFCWIRLAAHLRKARYIFGWPSTDFDSSHGKPGEPVWVYYIPRVEDFGFVEQVIGEVGLEMFLGLQWLAGCKTMDEYCDRLRIHGAVYYSDVRNSPEAREMGLVEASKNLEDERGSDSDHRVRIDVAEDRPMLLAIIIAIRERCLRPLNTSWRSTSIKGLTSS